MLKNQKYEDRTEPIVYDNAMKETETESEKKGTFDYINWNGAAVVQVHTLEGRKDIFQWKDGKWVKINIPPESLLEECIFLKKSEFQSQFQIDSFPGQEDEPKYYDIEDIHYCDWRGNIYRLLNNGTWEKVPEEKQIDIAGKIHLRGLQLTFKEIQADTKKILSGQLEQLPKK